MSDLISRSAVTELIESRCTDGCLGTEDTTLIDAYGLIDDISDMPTAYDVDAVVEQIQNLQKDKYVLSPIMCYALDKAIEIIRKGGVE